MVARLNFGHSILAVTALFFTIASYAIIFSVFLPLTGVNLELLHTLTSDTHYKYFVLFIMPTGAYFVIANWVGWQYYRNS